MTGIHALHMVIGLRVMIWLVRRVWRGLYPMTPDGTIILDKDFGAGYSFPVMIADASITSE